jgi:myo-inositol-1-phosphate synthase
MQSNKLGVALVGMGGAVATTAIAGIEMIRAGSNGLGGLPLADAHSTGLTAYRDIYFDGWDLSDDDLGQAATRHGIIGEKELCDGASNLRGMRPRASIGSLDSCPNIDGRHKITSRGHRESVEKIQADIEAARIERGVDRMVMINLASTERHSIGAAEMFQSVESFERGLDDNDPHISPAMLYAYAAISSGTPYANFTPSTAADLPALTALATQHNVAIGGKDGKTGQTLLKTVIAPALRDRALHVDGWFSTNILGNSDGKALDDPQSLASKVATKKSVLDDMLGYPVDDHIVHIHYYKPRGDDKEAWDNIDISGFLGQRMQLKINFLCKDSVLAAPLVIEIARLLDLARFRNEGGIVEPLGVFFKAPQTRSGRKPEHAFARQQLRLESWLAEGQ